MRTFFVLSAALALVAGCGKPSPAPDDDQPAGQAAAAARAREIFAARCTPCHGPAGAGDGPASQNLVPHPRNFHDPAWQASIDDAYIEKIIKYGGAAVGKSPAMPGNPDLTDPAVVAELRGVVRGFKP